MLYINKTRHPNSHICVGALLILDQDMAHLHQHPGQNHINFGSIGQKIIKAGEIAASLKGICETAVYLKNAIAPIAAAGVAMI